MLNQTQFQPLFAIPSSGSAEPKADMDMRSCIIIGNTVTGCNRMGAAPGWGDRYTMRKPGEIITPVVATYTSISGTLSTTNIVVANWSRMMWQDVMNRELRMLAYGPFKSHFFSALVTVNGS
ncbi:hypothetical protein KIN20_020461 [Parelaphostrongylus tenuis]|uniref:Uncharacterized protein n=1 Tax=Parelaphostrongylus tenuis TaxID=148309 RepID=A0AAD5QTR3_PARTN|nr:hypothetical protein KIN20_020461 [Parelaphostrongylus tenuis]